MSFVTWLKDFFLSGDKTGSTVFPHNNDAVSSAVKHTGSGAGKYNDDADDITDPLNPLNPLSPLNPVSPLNPLSPMNQTGNADTFAETGAAEIKPAIDLTDASRIENYTVYEASPLYMGHELGTAPNDHISGNDPLDSGFSSAPDPVSDFTGTSGFSGMDSFGSTSGFGSSSGFGSDPF